jgi:hypothetical protein
LRSKLKQGPELRLQPEKDNFHSGNIPFIHPVLTFPQTSG